MNMTSKQIRSKTEEIGIHFFQSFGTDIGVAIGMKFISGGSYWIVGRIDNVVYKEGLLHVEGRCIKEVE